MAAPYQSILQVPTFVPRDQEADYTNWLNMMQDTEGSRAELAVSKMDTLKSMLDRIPGFTSMMEAGQNVISSALEGNLTETHQQVLSQQAAAQRLQQGVQGGAGAGVNMSLASFGRAGLAAQQNALAQIPQFAAFSQNAFMGNIANDPSVTGPSWGSWSSQLQADTRDIYESKLAQAKAMHQVQQMNEQFTVQENQRVAAQQRMEAQQAERYRQQRSDMFAQAITNRQNSAFQGFRDWTGSSYESSWKSRMANTGAYDPRVTSYGGRGLGSSSAYYGGGNIDMTDSFHGDPPPFSPPGRPGKITTPLNTGGPGVPTRRGMITSKWARGPGPGNYDTGGRQQPIR
jgi:hypothetical protein